MTGPGATALSEQREERRTKSTPEKITIKIAVEADEGLKMIGALEDFVSTREIEHNATVAEMKAELVERCGPVKKSLKRWVAALKKWATKGAEFPEGSRTLELNFGCVWFRWTPWRIEFRLDEETVIERLRARGMTSCIRTVESVNKEALEAYDDDVLKAVGAYRDRDEKFYYEVKREEVKG